MLIEAPETLAEPTYADDRIRCLVCRNRERSGECSAAASLGATRTYRPDEFLLRRCEAFLPRASEKDQRAARVRWPNLTRSADSISLPTQRSTKP